MQPGQRVVHHRGLAVQRALKQHQHRRQPALAVRVVHVALHAVHQGGAASRKGADHLRIVQPEQRLISGHRTRAAANLSLGKEIRGLSAALLPMRQLA